MARVTAGQELGKVMTFRLSFGDASLVTAAATVGGRDVSAFVRSAVLTQARRQLASVVNGPDQGGADHG